MAGCEQQAPDGTLVIVLVYFFLVGDETALSAQVLSGAVYAPFPAPEGVEAYLVLVFPCVRASFEAGDQMAPLMNSSFFGVIFHDLGDG